jgi:hypothetical protein
VIVPAAVPVHVDCVRKEQPTQTTNNRAKANLTLQMRIASSRSKLSVETRREMRTRREPHCTTVDCQQLANQRVVIEFSIVYRNGQI